MTYLEIKEKLDKAVADKNTDAVLELFSVQNAITLRDYNFAFSQRKKHYQNLRTNFESLAKVSDDDFEVIFNSGLSTDEKNKRLSELGIKIEKTNKGLWRPFK